jgi:hypothetical protein
LLLAGMGKHLPMLKQFFGNAAVRRIEVFLGVPLGGAKPAVVATAHLYIRDRNQYSAADREGQKELMQIDNKYTNITNFMFADSKVTVVL